MTREDLLQKVSAAIDETLYAYSHGEMSDDMAKESILALIPEQPKLEWREQYLMIGNLSVGYYHVAGNGWHAHVGIGRHGKYFGPSNDENVARTAVERAVKEALGWPK